MFLNNQQYELKYSKEVFELIMYCVVAFFIPLFSSSQLITGTVVNFLLIVGALNIRKYKLIPIIIMPSLGVLFFGLLFWEFTMFLVYMIPFIWLGNLLLILAFKFFNLTKRFSYFSTLFIGASVKASLLFFSALVLFKFGVIPVMFLTAMGIMQFYTALLGGSLAFIYQTLKKKVDKII